ncbi:sugar-binding transcriptional regulator [Tumebacillus flagellatus]|uniref:Central glycolytic genes regulator n=1 Tax=Tumebacillus flagellatus TaxID=1157490 RepID=A0A074LPN2_9BACL|nr:sugar-binding domain-containing protein [Tumebacillus flagellatus]KEO82455.1 central glycolytic genes regulator [Tumebacillus flagellatus]
MPNELLALQQLLVPDLLTTMKKRYRILHHLFLTQPIGRRALAQQLQTTERILRAEVDFLKEQGLLTIETVGMHLTESGKSLLDDLADVIREIEGLGLKERRLADKLGLQQVRIVPGDADHDPLVIKALGHSAADYVRGILKSGDILAVTGGTTVATVAEQMPRTQLGVEVLPARGGIGENMEFQANTIASKLATKLGGTYRMLHAPDLLGDEALQTFISEPHVQDTLQRIRSARMVVHGIGQAIPMAKRRKLPPAKIEQLAGQGAIAEAFGYYFDRSGNIVHAMNTVGLRVSDLKHIEQIVAVAGGKSKAEAISAVAHGCPLHVLVTDEAVADAILESRREERT